mmetsp:Transcript_55538/g.66977  ORF Transcript_55538/g.66977 Transcript_55538/m.66977 type:complete len:347 (+) Transcript_55538:99-1139(+)
MASHTNLSIKKMQRKLSNFLLKKKRKSYNEHFAIPEKHCEELSKVPSMKPSPSDEFPARWVSISPYRSDSMSAVTMMDTPKFKLEPPSIVLRSILPPMSLDAPLRFKSSPFLPSILPPMALDDESESKSNTLSVPGSSHITSRLDLGQTFEVVRTTAQASFLSKSKYFRRLTEWAFHVVNGDRSGKVDKKDVHAGLLLIHLQIALFSGPAACIPASWKKVEEMFELWDVEKSGYLNEDEFSEIMSLLCARIIRRVAIQWSLILLLTPLLIYIFSQQLELILLTWSGLVVNSSSANVSYSTSRTVDETSGMITGVENIYFLNFLSCMMGFIFVPCCVLKINNFLNGN